MLELTKSIYTKASGSDFMSYIGNRLYKGRAPDDTIFPYSVYFVISDIPHRTFTEIYENVTIQFSLFSDKSSTTEIETMYAYLEDLYDECDFDIIEEKLIWMKLDNAVFQREYHTTLSGEQALWVYHVDFEIVTLYNPYAVIWQDTAAVEFDPVFTDRS